MEEEREMSPNGKRLDTQELTLNLGPQHPATHGVLRMVLELDGETVVKCTPYVGYLHRGIEKLGEGMTYPSALPLTDRLDYIAAMSNNTGYAVAVETLIGIDPPERAKYIRTIMCEMSRISSHIIWIATHALDIGAMTVFLYGLREREWLLDLFEMTCGARLTVSYPRIGGVRNDVSQKFLDSLWEFTEQFPGRVREYETLIDRNRIWLKRTEGIGVISAKEAVNWGLTGPTLRGSGVNYDVRKAHPYDAYDKMDFDVPLGVRGDVYDRYRCRMEEMLQSNRIIRQCIQQMPKGPVRPGKGQLVAPAGEIYRATEVPKGELGFYLVSDGTGKPYRMRVRAPSFVHASVLPRLCVGGLVADVIANIGTIDIVLGECDR